MVMESLKSATAEIHNQVESLAFSNNIMNGSLTMEQYKWLIWQNYILHASSESLIDKVLPVELKNELNLSKRQKLRLLQRDIHHLNITNYSKNLLLDINSAAKSLGVMYVLEGSTLGGAVIRRHLESNPRLSAVTQYNFYGCYGQDTGKMWMEFKAVTEKYSVENSCEKEIVDSAVNFFQAFGALLKENTLHTVKAL